jgi:hypothetical protein
MIAEENIQREEVVHERAKVDLRNPVELERSLVRSAVDGLVVAGGHGEHVLEDRGLVEHAPRNVEERIFDLSMHVSISLVKHADICAPE